MNPHIGSSFDSFLEKEGLLFECEVAAIRRVVALKKQKDMHKIMKHSILKTILKSLQ